MSNVHLRFVMGESRITEGMVCAGAGGKDTCQGDSGGPLVTRNDQAGDYSVIGIPSWGEGCARPDTLGVYNNIANYNEWIATNYGFSGVGPDLRTDAVP